MIKPAKEGKGIIAGGVVRIILEMAGVPNAVGKILSRTTNKVTLSYAVIEALKKLDKIKKPQKAKAQPNKKVKEKPEVKNK